MIHNGGIYGGREQTYIKHAFLRCYLEGLAIKVLSGGWPIFNYVDGFAGPWKIRDPDSYTDASFGLAVELLEAVREFVEKRKGRKLKVRFCLCEKDTDRVTRLRDYANRNFGFEIYVFEGAFENNLDAIAACIPDGFTFTFIDPTNWVVRIAEVCDFLKARRGEFLFNFMTEEVSRHSVNPLVAHQFGDFVGDPDWQIKAQRLPDDMRSDLKLLHLLKDAFRKRGAAKFLPDFSILKPLANREKMRLMLGTDRREGVKLFRDVHAKVEEEEFKTRREAKAAKTKQDMLFSQEDFAQHEQGERGVGCRRYKQLAEKRIIEVLSDRQPVRFADLSLNVMEEVAVKETHVKDVVKDMKARGVVAYDVSGRATKPNAETQISLVDNSR